MLDNIPVVGLTAPATLLLVVVLILRGHLVPRSTLVDKIEEVKEWREAYENQRIRADLATAQTGELLELARTTDSFIRSVFVIGERIRQSGGSDAPSQTQI